MLMVLYSFFFFHFPLCMMHICGGRDGGGGVVEERLCLSTYGPEVDLGSHPHCSSFLFSEAGSVDQTQSAQPRKS